MLIARIKGVNRKEIRVFVFGHKKQFQYKGVTYHIKPNCIYGARFLDFFGYNAIDYIQGESEPIPYYEGSVFDKRQASKNLDTISMVVNRWLQGRFLHFQLIMLILAFVSVGLIVGVLVTCLAIASKLGVI